MEKEGFSIANIDIIAKTPCCDVKLVMDGNVIWQREKVSFAEVRELMAGAKANCENILKQLDKIEKK